MRPSSARRSVRHLYTWQSLIDGLITRENPSAAPRSHFWNLPSSVHFDRVPARVKTCHVPAKRSRNRRNGLEEIYFHDSTCGRQRALEAQQCAVHAIKGQTDPASLHAAPATPPRAALPLGPLTKAREVRAQIVSFIERWSLTHQPALAFGPT